MRCQAAQAKSGARTHRTPKHCVQNSLPAAIPFAQLSECDASSRRFNKSTCSFVNRKRFNPSTDSILFALVVFRRRDAINYGVGMKHYRDKVKEKETDPEPGRRDGSQKDENSDRNSAGHPQKAYEFMSFVDMSQTGNDA